jgi:hypothetical protein
VTLDGAPSNGFGDPGVLRKAAPDDKTNFGAWNSGTNIAMELAIAARTRSSRSSNF